MLVRLKADFDVIENRVVDKDLADQVWEDWDTGEIDDEMAWLSWWLVTLDDGQINQTSTMLKR